MNEKELFNLVVKIGEIMLKNGGEIFRAIETMECAANRFGIREFSTFVIANGIFASVAAGDKIYSCKICYLPISPICLGKVEMLNSLSRRIGDGSCTPEETAKELDRINHAVLYKNWAKILAAGVGSFTFCFLFMGSWTDCAAAFLAGGFAFIFTKYWVMRIFSTKIMGQILGAAVAAFTCCVFQAAGFGHSLDLMIIGAIFPMVPGVSLTNAIRNFLENDYLTGVIRLVDALVVAGCVACGVGIAMSLWRMIGGLI